MKQKFQREISRVEPDEFKLYTSSSTIPLFTAYGCVLIERELGNAYIYTAINLKTGMRQKIARRGTPLPMSGVDEMAEKISKSSVADPGRIEAERQFGSGIALDNCHEILDVIFKTALPLYDYKVRSEQMSLAHHILDVISERKISLAEAEVGTGKTLAYLVPTILAKYGRLNGYCNMSFYTGSPYVDLMDMPIVIATSSIALQRALVNDYIPELSKILIESGIIRKPLTAALRKGREHYVCEQKLRTYIKFERNQHNIKVLQQLLKPSAQIDLAEIDNLTPYMKRRISVPARCDKNCPNRDSCQYLQFRREVQSNRIDIQVCNHNYLLADAIRRSEEKAPLIPNYQMMVIDEAHKFLQAARSMYGVEFSNLSASGIKKFIFNITIKHEGAKKLAEKSVKLLADESKSLFRLLTNGSRCAAEEAEGEHERFAVHIDANSMRHLRNIQIISDRLISLLNVESVTGRCEGRKMQALWELELIRNQMKALMNHKEIICWLEKDTSEKRFCAIPKSLSEYLYDDLWSKGIPTILTSGTLSAAGDFTRIKDILGLSKIGSYRITETSKPSPFNYKENSMIYISEDMPFPDQQNPIYIKALADNIEKLILTSNGHAAVLFTSYKVMDKVWAILTEQKSTKFPMFRLGRRNIREIERFKESGNGVLFAAGALWEGIDIPGDSLSMLIIAKLPFAVPDPIGEYEQSLYKSIEEYKENVIKPDMLIKSKQGSGRLIRTESDTGIIAILDSRVSIDGTYRRCLLDTLHKCKVTGNLTDVNEFYRGVKKEEYFK